ncbi:MAG TPA: glycosyltransferase [Methylocystis sp.]|nr:glycosyltransferase [Methylocystis sp.]
MAKIVPVAVVIPTFNRCDRLCHVLERILRCDPAPAEIWVHVDGADAHVADEVRRRFSGVNVIGSRDRVGPGGGRHRCLLRCASPLAASFDDDSYPVDEDFFGSVVNLFESQPQAALIGASIWRHGEADANRRPTLDERRTFTGCGHALRVSAYREITGYAPRPIAYGVEENDVALQLAAKGKKIYGSDDLRVFHDTDHKHHDGADITEFVVANAALLAFLRYPAWLWSLGALQVASIVVHCLRVGRRRGVIAGLTRIPADCRAYRRLRAPLPARAVVAQVWARRLLG